MIRKFAIAGATVVGGLMLLNWAGLNSYWSTAVHNIRTHLKHQVPLEFEIQRVRNEIAQLGPDMKEKCRSIAEEMVAIDNLKEEIKVTEANLKQQKDNVRAMAQALETGVQTVSFDHRDYSAHRLSERLSRDVNACKRCEKEVAAKRAQLEAKENGLAAARERLETVRTEKEELEAQVDRLEADLKTVQAAQARSKFQYDDSKLSQCKQTLQEIRNRLNVELKACELEGQFAGDVAQPEAKGKSVSEVTKEAKDYLGGANGDTDVAANRK